MATQTYKIASRALMDQAALELSEGDVRQASEKGWEAAAQMIKAVSEQRGGQHHSHALLYQIVRKLVEETGDSKIFNLFHVAGNLHTNFYENWNTSEGVEAGLGVSHVWNRRDRGDGAWVGHPWR